MKANKVWRKLRFQQGSTTSIKHILVMSFIAWDFKRHVGELREKKCSIGSFWNSCR